MKVIYKNKITGRFYRMLPGQYPYSEFYDWGLWQDVRKFLWFWLDVGQPFWLDRSGFTRI